MMRDITNKFKTLLFFFKPRKIVAQYKLFFGDEWLEVSVDSIAPHVYKILLVVSDVAWGDDPKNPQINGDDLESVIAKLKAKYAGKIIVYKGSWNQQLEHVQAGLNYIKQNIKEASHCLYIDGDEIYKPDQIKKLKRLTLHPSYFNAAIRINYHTYFKSIVFRVTPSKGPCSLTIFPLRTYINYLNERNVSAGIKELPNFYFEHYSYLRVSDTKVQQKVVTHKSGNEPMLDNWYDKVWLTWTPETRNFHPTHPEIFEAVEYVSENEIPKSIREVFAQKFNHD